MAVAKEKTVVSTDLTAVREVDFATQFSNEIRILTEILGNIRVETHEAGTKIMTRSAEVTLSAEKVDEGAVIPYNQVEYKNEEVGKLEFDKQSIGVTLEAIAAHGYEAAVQAADDDMMFKLRGNIVKKFMTFIQTGKLKVEEGVNDFQMAIAEAIGQVDNKWEEMGKGYSEIIGFCNTLDAYRYLGAANITTQTQFGLTYLENFMGFRRLFLTSKIPSGKVVATPSKNLVMYHIDASDNDYAKAGFEFRMDEDNLIAVHVEGNHTTMVSELTTVTGIAIFAEYIDGVAVVSITEAV